MSNWEIFKSQTQKELRFWLSMFVVNILIVVMSLVAIGVSADVYLRQRSQISEYAETSVNPPVLVVGLSCLICIISISLGCVATLKFKFKLLKIFFYALIIEIITLLLLTFLVMFLFGANDAVQAFEDKFQAGILEYDDNFIETEFMDKVQTDFHCCGINTFHDWEKKFKCASNSTTNICEVPVTCCIIERTNCQNYVENSTASQVEGNIHTQGCVPAVKDVVQHNAFVVGGLCFGEIIFLIIEAVLVGLYIYKRFAQMKIVSQVAD